MSRWTLRATMVRATTRLRLRGRGPVACMTLLLAGPVAVAEAAPADRAAAVAVWSAVEQSYATPAGWSGAVAGCSVGTESATSLNATLGAINALRDFAGVPPVALDPELNRKALAAALMMRAAGRLSHYPDPAWPCASDEGIQAAGSSNLYLGLSGPKAMVGYVNDAGVDSLGHRLWLLNPLATIFGSGSTGSSNALWVTSHQTGAPVPNRVVAWPPAGWVPWQWVFGDWSAVIGTPIQAVDVTGASVAVSIDGVPAAVTGTTQLGSAYGGRAALKWRVDVPGTAPKADRRIDVAISGVTIDGASFPITYTANAFQAGPPILGEHDDDDEDGARQSTGSTAKRSSTSCRKPGWKSAPRAKRRSRTRVRLSLNVRCATSSTRVAVRLGTSRRATHYRVTRTRTLKTRATRVRVGIKAGKKTGSWRTVRVR